MYTDPAKDDDNKNPSNTNELLTELGFPGKEAPPVGNMPPNDGKFPLPHYLTFAGVYNLAQRAYRYTFDDALLASPENARTMRRDPVLMHALRARQMPTCQLSWHIEPEDITDNEQAEAAKKITQIIHEIPNFQQLKRELLEAIWYGHYGVQLVYGWDFSRGEQRLIVKDHAPINGDKIVFKWGAGFGVLVNSIGGMDIETSYSDRGLAHFFTEAERESIIIHRFEPEDADFFNPQLAGAINGVGVRGRLYWFWWLKQQIFALLMDYLQRCALGCTIYSYPGGNVAAQKEVERYAQQNLSQTSLIWPSYKDDKNGSYGIQRFEPGLAGAQLLENMVSSYFDDVMRRYILGQDLSSESSPTGIGSSVGDLHSDTLSRIIKYDAVDLSETLTRDLVKVLYKYNCPNIPYGRFKFDVDVPNAGDVLGYAETMYQMGLPINGDELYTISGLSKPLPNSNMVNKMGALQPTSIGNTPEGVPAQGNAGPINTQNDVIQQQPQPQ